MSRIKFAILGAGEISKQMARTVAGMESVEPYAVASRDKGRAEAFAREWGFERAYGAYEEMLADDEVGVVYVATPISHHLEHIKMCLSSGRAVLCEKAFTINAGQAREAVALAEEKKLALVEAIWPRFMPMAVTLRDLLRSGRIGEPTSLFANLGYPVWHKDRLRDPHLGGGALLDIGIYPLTFASIAFGDDIESIRSTAVMSGGVDKQHSVMLSYRDGRMATLIGSAINTSDRSGIIYGTEGYSIVSNVNNFEDIRIFGRDHREIDAITRPPQITGYEYEVEATVRAIRSGAIECPEMTHRETIRMMELMDRIRAAWGMKYPME